MLIRHRQKAGGMPSGFVPSRTWHTGALGSKTCVQNHGRGGTQGAAGRSDAIWTRPHHLSAGWMSHLLGPCGASAAITPSCCVFLICANTRQMGPLLTHQVPARSQATLGGRYKVLGADPLPASPGENRSLELPAPPSSQRCERRAGPDLVCLPNRTPPLTPAASPTQTPSPPRKPLSGSVI